MQCVPDALAVLKQHGANNGCSKSPWAERVAGVLHRESPITLVNVGANKGYKVPEFLALWSKPAHRVEGYNRGWQRHLLAYAKQIHSGHLKSFSCGNCGDCNAEAPPAHNRSAAVRIHLLEIAPANQMLLRHVIQATSLDDVVSLHPFGGSNVRARVPIIKSVLPGDERQGVLVGKKAARFNSANASVLVDVVALDDFFAAHGLTKIYHVSIDTEGFDSLVIEGMRGAISRRQVSIVEFEVNTLGFWSRGRLNQAFAVFDAARYSCFWVLPSGLLPASGACLTPQAERGRLKWSNVVCAHEPEVVTELSALAHESYVARATGGRGAKHGGKRGGRGGGRVAL